MGPYTFQEYLETLTEDELVWAARFWALSRAAALVEWVIASPWKEAVEVEVRELIASISVRPEFLWLSRVRHFLGNVRGKMLPAAYLDDGPTTELRIEARELWKFIDRLTLGLLAAPMELMEQLTERHRISSWLDTESIGLLSNFLSMFRPPSTNAGGLSLSMSDDRLLLRFSIDPDTDEDIAADAIFSIVHALSALHVAMGGSGLQIDDWQPLVHENAPAEVLL